GLDVSSHLIVGRRRLCRADGDRKDQNENDHGGAYRFHRPLLSDVLAVAMHQGCWTVMYPSLTAAAGKFVAPRLSVRLPVPSAFVATATVNGTSGRTGVPLPGSTLQVPEKTALFDSEGTLLLAWHSTWISCPTPRAVTPASVVWNCPRAQVPAMLSPIPSFRDFRATPR